MTDLAALLERVKQAKGPSRELDEAIGRWLWDQGFKPWECYDYTRNGPGKPFTSSIDAALALVEKLLPGWVVQIHGTSAAATVFLYKPTFPFCDAPFGAGPAVSLPMPLAILAALLQALLHV